MPPILSLATRFLSDRLKGLGAWSLAAFWWLLEWAGDKLLGDAAFGWLRDMVSPLAQYAWLALLWTYGIPLGLVGLGAFFFWRAGNPLSQASLAAPEARGAAGASPTATAPSPIPAASAPKSTATSAETSPRARSASLPTPAIAKVTPRPIRPEASQILPGWEDLYRMQDDGGIELAFPPDTPHPKKDTFVLLLYAYFLLYGDEKVSGPRIYGDMDRNFHKVWRRFQRQEAGLFEFIGSMNTKDWGQQAVDANLVLRVDLATRPSYRLTVYGQSHAYDLALSLIARA